MYNTATLLNTTNHPKQYTKFKINLNKLNQKETNKQTQLTATQTPNHKIVTN